MTIPVEICLRGDDYATNDSISGIPREPRAWTDADVRLVLEGMLQAMHRRKHPEAAPDRVVALRGLSWIVSPFESGGVVIAIEITMGVAVAGPLDVDQASLETLVARVLARPRLLRHRTCTERPTTLRGAALSCFRPVPVSARAIAVRVLLGRLGGARSNFFFKLAAVIAGRAVILPEHLCILARNGHGTSLVRMGGRLSSFIVH